MNNPSKPNVPRTSEIVTSLRPRPALPDNSTSSEPALGTRNSSSPSDDDLSHNDVILFKGRQKRALEPDGLYAPPTEQISFSNYATENYKTKVSVRDFAYKHCTKRTNMFTSSLSATDTSALTKATCRNAKPIDKKTALNILLKVPRSSRCFSWFSLYSRFSKPNLRVDLHVCTCHPVAAYSATCDITCHCRKTVRVSTTSFS